MRAFGGSPYVRGAFDFRAMTGTPLPSRERPTSDGTGRKLPVILVGAFLIVGGIVLSLNWAIVGGSYVELGIWIILVFVGICLMAAGFNVGGWFNSYE